jgi:hypothetical protein
METLHMEICNSVSSTTANIAFSPLVNNEKSMFKGMVVKLVAHTIKKCQHCRVTNVLFIHQIL